MTDKLPEVKETTAPAVQMPFNMGEMWESLKDLAKDKSADPGLVKAWADLQMDVYDRLRQEQFNRDFNAAAAEMPRITKDGKIEHNGRLISRYATYPHLYRCIQPILAKHNFAMRHDVDTIEGGKMTVQAVVLHSNGLTVHGGKMVLPLDSSGAKSGPQQSGSTMEYGRRYTTKAMWHIIEDGIDTDASDVPLITEDKFPETLKRAEKEALNGLASYQAWFKALPVDKRNWLYDHPRHEELKKEAAKHAN